MSDGFTIRMARREDFPEWSALWEGYNAFYGRSESSALPTEVTSATWSRFFDAYEPMFALVAESEGGLLGLAHFLLHRSTTAVATSCYLQDLFTDPSARGRGVGAALIEDVYSRAQAAECSRVYWQTHEGNVAARRLYDRLAHHAGFVVYAKTFE